MGTLENELSKQIESMKLSDFERKALRELMLKGKIGKVWGNSKIKERNYFLSRWINLELILITGELTALGKLVATPSYLVLLT